MSWKSGSLNLLEPSGPHRACCGIPLTFTFIAYYECVFVTVAFAVSPSVACATLAILFSALSHKLYDLKKNVIEHKMCGLIFCTTFVLKNSHSRKNYTIYDIFVNCNWVVTRWQ